MRDMFTNRCARLLCLAVLTGALVGLAPGIPPAVASNHQSLNVDWQDTGSPTATAVPDSFRGPGDSITFSGNGWAPSQPSFPNGVTGTAIHISAFYATSTSGWHEPVLLTTCTNSAATPVLGGGGDIEQPCAYQIPSDAPVPAVTYTFLATQTWSDGTQVSKTVDVAGTHPSQPPASVGYDVSPEIGTPGTQLAHTGCGYQTLGGTIPLHPFMSTDNVDGGDNGEPTRGPIEVTHTTTPSCAQGGGFDVTGTVPNLAEGNYWVVLTKDSAGNEVVTQGDTETFQVGTPPPTVNIADPAPVQEGDQGQTRTVTFTVTLSEASGKAATVTVTTKDGSATAPSDYISKTQVLVFPAGTTSRDVTVTVRGDDLVEPDEDFFLEVISARDATVGDGSGRALIVNDDVGVSINDPSPVQEGDQGQTTTVVFTVTISPASDETVTVTVTTRDGTANAGADYQSTTRRLVFPAGTTTQTVTVTVLGDDNPEADEHFFLDVFQVENAGIADGTGRAVVTDDDSAVSVNDPSPVQEPDLGQTTTVVFTLTVSPASDETVTVTVTTRDGTATAGTDYQATTQTVVFQPGATTRNVSVTVLGDNQAEGDEDFFLDITDAENAAVTDGTGRAVIADDEQLPVASVRDPEPVEEGDAGPTPVVFIVELSNSYPLPVTVTVETEDGTAQAGSDYNPLTTIVVFPPGSTSQPVTVTVNGDTEDEDDEFFFLVITDAENATTDPDSGTDFGVAGIFDDDGEVSQPGPVGGTFGGGPAAVSWGENRIDVFVRGADDALWHKWWDGTSWQGYESLGGVLDSAPEVSSWDAGRLDIFVKGTDGGLWHKWYDGTAWHGWESLGGTLTSDPSAVSWGPNRIDLFVRGTDAALWHQSYNGTWSGWQSLGGVLTSGADAASWAPGRLDVFVRGTDGALWHQFFNGSWSGWSSQGGILQGDPSAVSWGPNRIDVFVRGSDDQLYHNWFNGTWGGWESLGGVLTASPDSSSWAVGRLDVFVRGTDGGLWHKWYGPGWSGFESLGGFIHE